jgi:HK97 family phage major capsid protein
MNIIELRRKLAEVTDKMRALLESANTEARSLTTEEDATFGTLRTEAETLRAAIDRAIEVEGLSQVAGANLAETRGAASNVQPTKRTKDSVEAIYCRWVRSGDPVAHNEWVAGDREVRASNDTTMNITTAADGGDLVPVGHSKQIIERARPERLDVALGVRNIPGQGTTVNVPVDNEADSGVFVSTNESGNFDRDAPAVAKVAMTLVKYTKKIDLTYELLQDEDSRLMEFLDGYVAAGMAATLNSLLVAEALADGTAALTFDSATAIATAEVPELLYKLKAEYATGKVAWLWQRATEGVIRGKVGDNFQFAPTPAGQLGDGVRSFLFGVPAYSTSFMGALSASGKSLLVGNFNYMGMRLDPNLTVLRDPYSRAGNGEVILHYYFRTDFEVLQAEAFQYGTHPSA